MEREYWEEYTRAYEEMLEKTSHVHSPWFVVPSDHKWFRNLAISQIIVESLERLKLMRPEPTVDINEIRKKYHEDVLKEETPRHKGAA